MTAGGSNPPPPDYEALISEAQAAVGGITNPVEKDVAFNAILAHLISKGIPKKKPWRYFSYGYNTYPALVAILLATCAFLSLWFNWSLLASGCVAGLIDAFILYLMLIVGLHSDGRANTYASMPHRLPALLIGALLFAGLLCSFGNMCISRAKAFAQAARNVLPIHSLAQMQRRNRQNRNFSTPRWMRSISVV
jgi:hypothetical protein